jgi:hypothetical protein
MNLTSERKLEIFVGATNRDLGAARTAVINAILEKGHVPSGMELWAAGNRPPLDVIARYLKRCDAHILMLGARYGSPVGGRDGISFTEWDYQQSRDHRPLAHPDEQRPVPDSFRSSYFHRRRQVSETQSPRSGRRSGSWRHAAIGGPRTPRPGSMKPRGHRWCSPRRQVWIWRTRSSTFAGLTWAVIRTCCSNARSSPPAARSCCASAPKSWARSFATGVAILCSGRASPGRSRSSDTRSPSASATSGRRLPSRRRTSTPPSSNAAISRITS